MAICGELDLEFDDVLHEIHECIQKNISPSVFDANGEGKTAALSAALSLALEHSTVAALVPVVAQYQQYEGCAPQGLLLSDLGALLPEDTRQQVKAQLGGLRSVLLRHPHAFKLAGEPGKEVVQLVGAGPGTSAQRRGSRESLDSGAPTPRMRRACTDPTPRRGARTRRASRETDATMTPQLTPHHRRGDEGLFRRPALSRRASRERALAVPTLKLRGLPFTATEADVCAFVRAQGVEVAQSRLSLVRTRDGRSTGFATLEFDDLPSAAHAQEQLHMRVAGDRYVEVFLKMQQPPCRAQGKPQHDSPGTSTRSGSEDDRSSFGDSSAGDDVTEEHAVEELETFLSSHPQGVLLSMLGIAAGDATKAWMRDQGLGLKQLLARHAGKFVVEGDKGKQAVRLRPAVPQFPDLALPPLPIGFAASVAAAPFAWPMPPPELWPLLFPLPVPQVDLVQSVRLRGLPFAAQEQDVFDWLKQEDMDAQPWCAEGLAAVQVVRRKNGRATGQAVVAFAQGAPRSEVMKLHMRCMGDRYIEVLDEPGLA